MYFDHAAYQHYPTTLMAEPIVQHKDIKERVSSNVNTTLVEGLIGSIATSKAYMLTTMNAAELVLEDLRKGRKISTNERGWE